MTKKVCFVVMGFGRKTDFENNRQVDLDIVYNEVIKPVFIKSFPDYKLIRADEVATSRIIDSDMYDLLLRADLVIADVTTPNPNAIYELGVRHALKPYSTIIMADDKSKFPFDLSRNRIFQYPEVGEKMTTKEKASISKHLTCWIEETIDKRPTDSPFYTYMDKVVTPPIFCEADDFIVEKAQKKDESINELMNVALAFMKKSEFEKAYVAWTKLCNIITGNAFFTQQRALAKYKSKKPDETSALLKALNIINELSPNTTLDVETLGLTGAIYKRLYNVNGENLYYLDKAILFYRKGYYIKNDSYNGENYVTCLLLRCSKIVNPEERDYLLFEAKKESENIISNTEERISSEPDDVDFWMYATLATCYHFLGNQKKYKENSEKFERQSKAMWEIKTFEREMQKRINAYQTITSKGHIL